MDDRIKVFNESGRGYWLEGFGCIRAGGGYNDANTCHAIVIEKEQSPMDDRTIIHVEGTCEFCCER